MKKEGSQSRAAENVKCQDQDSRRGCLVRIGNGTLLPPGGCLRLILVPNLTERAFGGGPLPRVRPSYCLRLQVYPPPG